MRGAVEGTEMGWAFGIVDSSSADRASVGGEFADIMSPLLEDCGVVDVSSSADVGVDCAVRLGKSAGGGYFWKKRMSRGGRSLAAFNCCEVLMVAELGVCCQFGTRVVSLRLP